MEALIYMVNEEKKVMKKFYGIPLLIRLLHSLKKLGTKKYIIVLSKKRIIFNKVGNTYKGIKIDYVVTKKLNPLEQILAAKAKVDDKVLALPGNLTMNVEVLRWYVEKEKFARNLPKGLLKEAVIVGKISKSNKIIAIARKDRLNKKLKINTEFPEEFFYYIENQKEGEKRVLHFAVTERYIPFSKIFFMMRYVHIPLFKLLLPSLSKTKVTANHITLLSFLSSMIASFLFFKINFLLASLFTWISVFLDGVDGKLARLKLIESEFGGIFDYTLDGLSHSAIIVGLTLGTWELMGNNIVLLFGFASLVGMLIYHYFLSVFYRVTKRHYDYIRWEKNIFKFRPQMGIMMYTIIFCSLIDLSILALIFTALWMNGYLFYRIVKLKKLQKMGIIN